MVTNDSKNRISEADKIASKLNSRRIFENNFILNYRNYCIN